MSILNVVIYPDPILVKKTKMVEEITVKTKTIIANMIETMYAQNGIGLAANQVGINLRILVIDISSKRNQAMALINPKLVESNGKSTATEGCLSFPGIEAEVTRADSIKIEATNIDGEKITINADGLKARCLQHEMDHLDGEVFIKQMSRLKQERVRTTLTKYKKQLARNAKSAEDKKGNV